MATRALTVRRRARRYFTRRRSSSRSMTVSIAVLAGLASPIGRTVSHAMTNGITGEEGAIAEISRIMTGFNPYSSTVGWQPWRMKYGLLPVVAGIAVHKLASILGINKAIARSGIPLLRI